MSLDILFLLYLHMFWEVNPRSSRTVPYINAGIKILDLDNKIILTLKPRAKENIKVVDIKLNSAGYEFIATEGTAKYLNNIGIDSEIVKKQVMKD